jgi:ubiquinone biosynthesis protein COQ9
MNDAALDAFLTCIATQGWHGTQVPDDDFLVLGDRWDALSAAGRRFDAAALAVVDEPRASVRDRLFERVMARFDAMQPWRAAIAELGRAAPRDPGLAAFFALKTPQSLHRIAAASGVDTGGLTGTLRVRVLTAQYLRAVRVWLDDESGDLSATMKAVDELLAEAERWATQLPFSRATAADPQPAPGPAAE